MYTETCRAKVLQISIVAFDRLEDRLTDGGSARPSNSQWKLVTAYHTEAMAMHEAFKHYVDALHPAFERLTGMEPVKLTALPKKLPTRCVYLFSEGDKHLYVGRTNQFRQRMRQHSIPSAQHNHAVFAFRLARVATGRTEVAYATKGGRVALAAEPEFATAFTDAKASIRKMDLRFVEENDALRQALLEIYAAVVLKTPHNSFENH
jgi:predicted GIY-YIG superfamily endonuclease